MFLLIFFLLLALSVSFLCSILEAVLLSITPSYIESIGQKKGKQGERLRELKESIDKPLSAILTLNTIAHTIGAAGVGAQASALMGENLWSLVVVPSVMTLLILILSEIIPKSLGANYWRQLAPFTTATLNFLVKILYPFVVLSKFITDAIAKGKKGNTISRDEISAMADIGQKEGIFEEGESRVLKNLLRFKQVKVEEIMTPRTVVVAAQQDKFVKEIYKDETYLRFTRIPIYVENIDQVVGFVHKHDILLKVAQDEHEVTLKSLNRNIMRVSEKMPVHNLYEQFVDKREHIALALDEYGGVSGVVTMEDALETLLGIEIMDEFDHTRDMQALAKQKWASRAKKLDINPE